MRPEQFGRCSLQHKVRASCRPRLSPWAQPCLFVISKVVRAQQHNQRRMRPVCIWRRRNFALVQRWGRHLPGAPALCPAALRRISVARVADLLKAAIPQRPFRSAQGVIFWLLCLSPQGQSGAKAGRWSRVPEPASDTTFPSRTIRRPRRTTISGAPRTFRPA
jgi:hypothetical protein